MSVCPLYTDKKAAPFTIKDWYSDKDTKKRFSITYKVIYEKSNLHAIFVSKYWIQNETCW